MVKVKSITIDNSCFTNNTFINSVDCNNVKWKDNSLSNAFKGCSSLTSISNIKNDITNLDSAFEGCSLLTGDIRLESENISSATNCFASTSLTKNVYIPYNSVTYNTLTSLGYNELGTLHGVYLKNKDGEESSSLVNLDEWNYTEEDGKYILNEYKNNEIINLIVAKASSLPSLNVNLDEWNYTEEDGKYILNEYKNNEIINLIVAKE